MRLVLIFFCTVFQTLLWVKSMEIHLNSSSIRRLDRSLPSKEEKPSNNSNARNSSNSTRSDESSQWEMDRKSSSMKVGNKTNEKITLVKQEMVYNFTRVPTPRQFINGSIVNVRPNVNASYGQMIGFGQPFFSMTSERKLAPSIARIFTQRPNFKLVRICKDNEFYDKINDRCRQKLSAVHLVPTYHIIRSDTIPFQDNWNKKREVQNCTDPVMYLRDEYTVSSDYRSAVVIKKTGELLDPKDYYINGTNKTLYVCREKVKCSKQWLQVERGEFQVLQNKSIFVNTTQQIYDNTEYIWQNHSLRICTNVSMEINYNDITNCSGEWVLMEDSEFTILSNGSVFVNASLSLYPPSKYIWQKGELYVCEHISNNPYVTEVYSNMNDQILAILNLCCMSVSIIALIFVLVTYSLFSELRTPPGINLMNLSVSILLSQLLWLLGAGQTDNPTVCTVIAVLLHYLFLVSFVWTSIIAFDTWRAFTATGRRSMSDSKRKRMIHSLRYMAVGWLSVMVYVAICVSIDQLEVFSIQYGSFDACWITDTNGMWIFFAFPLGLVTVFNIVFFSLTVKAIRTTRSQSILVDSANKRDFGVYVRIASVMGFTWVFGFAAPFGWVFLWYVFVILNCLQGVYIAIAFVLSKRTRKLYTRWCRTKQSASSSETHAQTASSSQVVSRNGKTVVEVLK